MAPADGNILDLCANKRRCSQCALRLQCLGSNSDEESLERLDRLVEYRPPLEAGETLYYDGDPMRTVYLVRSGALKSVVEHADGSGQVLGFHLPGELLGMDGFGTGRHGCRVEALERTRVCPLPWEALQTLAADLPGLQQQLIIAIGQETLAAHRHLSMMGCPAPRRLGMFLHDLSTRRAQLRLDADELQLPMSREDIANFLGMAEETVCRQFTRLQDAGILTVRRKTVRILDHERLAEVPAVRSARPLSAASESRRACA
jgi:CRP/FNR family transcriptional regulator, anaerobic regulatory protein